MAMGPNGLALIGALLLGVAVLFWGIALKRITTPELLLFLGTAYLVVGGAQYLAAGRFRAIPADGVRWGLVTGFSYAVCISVVSYAFGMKGANLPVVNAITAAYPLVTALLAVALLHSRFTGLQILFMLTGSVSVVGLALVSRQ